MDKLPVDVLLSVFDELELAAKASLALCNKVYFDLLKSQEVFSELRLEPSQLRLFLQALERDLPIERLFCPTCLTFHNAAVAPEITSTSLETELDTRPHTPEAFKRATEGRYESWWPCFREDFRNEISEFYGNKLNFCQARLALKLHSRKHDHTQEYLKSLDRLKVQINTGNIFYRREMRIVQEEGQPPQLFMRLQQWWIIDKHELKKHKLLNDESRQKPHVCYHRTDFYVDFGGKRATLAVQAWRIIQALEAAFDEDAKASRGRSGSKTFSRNTMAQDAGFYAIIHPNYVNHNDPVATISPDHVHSYLDHCFKCHTDFRLDAIRLETNPHSLLSFSRNKKNFAVVLTKWMNLGTLANQQSMEWQGHGYADPKETLVWTSKPLRNGEVMRGFEGQAEYRPKWSDELEIAWRNAR